MSEPDSLQSYRSAPLRRSLYSMDTLDQDLKVLPVLRKDLQYWCVNFLSPSRFGEETHLYNRLVSARGTAGVDGRSTSAA